MTWEFEPQRSAISFNATASRVSVRGSFRTFSLDASIDQQHPGLSHVSATIDASSIDTGNEARDHDLRSAAFLDVEHSPQITFESREVLVVGLHTVWIRGDLTVRGHVRSIVLAAEVNEFGHPEAGNHELVFASGIVLDWHDLVEFPAVVGTFLRRASIGISIRAVFADV